MTNPSLLIVPDRFKASKLYSQLPQDGSGDFVVTRATTAYRTNENGILESVASGVPRLDFPIGSGCPALLVEPAATNLLLRSEEFGVSPWVANDTLILSTNNLAPNGTNTATRIRGNGANKARQQVFTGTIGQLYTGSIYVRTISGSASLQIRVGDVLSTLSINPNSTWQRFQFSAAPTTTTVRFAIVFINDTDEFDIWGAQLETGSVATSYIPTVAATATRNADVIVDTAVSGLIGQTEGTLYAEVDIQRDVIGVPIVIDGGNASDFITFLKLATLQIRVQIRRAGGSVTTIITSSAVSIGIHKIALGYTNGDYALYIDGVSAGTSTNSTNYPAITLTRVVLSDSSYGPFNDRIRAAALYTTRLSNAQLQFLTTL